LTQSQCSSVSSSGFAICTFCSFIRYSFQSAPRNSLMSDNDDLLRNRNEDPPYRAGPPSTELVLDHILYVVLDHIYMLAVETL
jgi:hypothetical protein